MYFCISKYKTKIHYSFFISYDLEWTIMNILFILIAHLLSYFSQKKHGGVYPQSKTDFISFVEI